MVTAELNVVSDPKLVINVDIFRVRNNAFKTLCSLIVLPSAEFRFLCFLATYPTSHHLSEKAPDFLWAVGGIVKAVSYGSLSSVEKHLNFVFPAHVCKCIHLKIHLPLKFLRIWNYK